MDNVIVVSLRKGAKPIPEGYTPVRIDRTNPELGNPYPMKGNSAEERARVIQAFRKDLNLSRKEPDNLWRSVSALADRVANGEKLALQCWCAPEGCHGDVIKSAISYILRARRHPAQESVSSFKAV